MALPKECEALRRMVQASGQKIIDEGASMLENKGKASLSFLMTVAGKVAAERKVIAAYK